MPYLTNLNLFKRGSYEVASSFPNQLLNATNFYKGSEIQNHFSFKYHSKNILYEILKLTSYSPNLYMTHDWSKFPPKFKFACILMYDMK